jgi:S1-C subfamily serine protease
VLVTGVVSAAGQRDTLIAADVIYSINGSTVRNLAELEAALRALKPGSAIAVQIERLGQLQYLVVETQ